MYNIIVMSITLKDVVAIQHCSFYKPTDYFSLISHINNIIISVMSYSFVFCIDVQPYVTM